MVKERVIIVILALDQATAITGWAVFDGEKLVDHGKIKMSTSKKITPEAKSDIMMACIEELIDIYHPDHIVIEDVANQKNVATVVKLARLQGAIMEMRRKYDHASLEIVRPTEWRKGLKFRQGRAKREELKAQAQAFVVKTYNKQVSEDEADAICIGYFAMKEGFDK